MLIKKFECSNYFIFNTYLRQKIKTNHNQYHIMFTFKFMEYNNNKKQENAIHHRLDHTRIFINFNVKIFYKCRKNKNDLSISDRLARGNQEDHTIRNGNNNNRSKNADENVFVSLEDFGRKFSQLF